MSNNNPVWQLIEKLIEEATGMTGNEAVDTVRIERGAGYIRDFQKEFPLFSLFVKTLIDGTVADAISILKPWKPEIASLPFLNLFLYRLQLQLRPKK